MYFIAICESYFSVVLVQRKRVYNILHHQSLKESMMELRPRQGNLAHQTEIATLFAWVIKLHLTQVFSPRLKKYAKP